MDIFAWLVVAIVISLVFAVGVCAWMVWTDDPESVLEDIDTRFMEFKD